MRRCALALLAAVVAGCGQGPQAFPRHALFVGIDVSGSFRKTQQYDDAMEFLSYYLYGHLNGVGQLQPLKELFVGSIGGETVEETKSFHPIHDFRGKSAADIQADLKKWFPPSDHLTDFNIFFKQVARIAEQRNLALSPITVVMISDGVPALPAAAGKAEPGAVFDTLDLSPLEFLSRNVTLRLLYLSPVVAHDWETAVPRRRVRMWTVDQQVMAGWKAQMDAGAPVERQDKLWTWVRDNIDYRVRALRFRQKSRK